VTFFIMRLTVEQIMERVASTVNQESSAPAATSDEYSLWLDYINRGVHEWSVANDWESLKYNFWPQVSSSGGTVTLPLDFRASAGPVLLYDNGDYPTQFPEIQEEQSQMYSTTDKYVTLTGDINRGYSLVFHPATLASGASVVVPYYAMPTSLASPAQVAPVDDSLFLVDRTIAYILESRSDARFQLEENKARERLLLMVENANLAKFNSYAGSNPILGPERKQGFRLGRD
jgi:hypothetical protein